MTRPDGAPYLPGELDPELVRLRKPLPKLGAVASIAGAVLCLVMLWRLWPDARFATQTAPSSSFAPDTIAELAYDVVFARAVHVRRGVGASGMLVAPVLGSGDAKWIAAPGGGWNDPSGLIPARGRVRRIADTTFGANLAAYVASQPWPAFVPLADLRASNGAGASAARAVAISGEAVSPPADAPVTMNVVVPDRVRLRVTFGTRLPDERAWGVALVAAGLFATAPTSIDTNATRAIFEFMAPDAAATAESRLRDAELWGALVEPVTETITSTWGALTSGAPVTTNATGTMRTIPDSAIDLVRVDVRRSVPAHAMVLVAGELPTQFAARRWLWLAMWPLLLLFCWGVVRGLRAWR